MYVDWINIKLIGHEIQGKYDFYTLTFPSYYSNDNEMFWTLFKKYNLLRIT